MISVTKLLFARDYFGDRLRYTKNAHTMRNGAAEGVGPVVVWNSTKTCNLKCMHCYMQSDAKKYKDELTTEEAKKFIDDLADFHVPVLLFSGGEPLIRPDFFELAAYAQKKGVRPTLSTNGTLITREVAQRMGVSENTIEKHVGKGLRILTAAIGRGGNQRVEASRRGDEETWTDVAQRSRERRGH